MILVEELETAKTMGWHAKMSGSNPAAGAVVGTGCCSLLHPDTHTHINLRSHTKIKPGLSRARPRNVLHSVGAPIYAEEKSPRPEVYVLGFVLT